MREIKSYETINGFSVEILLDLYCFIQNDKAISMPCFLIFRSDRIPENIEIHMNTKLNHRQSWTAQQTNAHKKVHPCTFLCASLSLGPIIE